METSSTESIERLLCATPLYLPWDGPTPPKPSQLGPGSSRWVALATCWVHRRGVLAGWRGSEDAEGWQALHDILVAGGWGVEEAAGGLALLARLDRLSESLGALVGVSAAERAQLWRAMVGADLRHQVRVTGALLIMGPDLLTRAAARALCEGAWLPLDLRRGKLAPLHVEHVWPAALDQPRVELFGARKGSVPGGAKGLKGALGRAGEWGALYVRDLHLLPTPEQDALAWALEREQYIPVGEDRAEPTPALLVATANAQAGASLTPALTGRLTRVALGGAPTPDPAPLLILPQHPDAGTLQPTLDAMARGEAAARAILVAYCKHLHSKLGTYEAVASVAGLDRRTVKKYIEAG
jgi:hypothetical protein